MRISKTTFLPIIITMTLISCGGATHHLASGSFSKNDTYEVNLYNGCCGCEAKYFTIFSGKRKIEQVVYSYNCYRPGKPTKFVFNYNKHGRLVSCNKYVATNSNDFTIKLSEYEQKLFSTFDTSSSMRPNYFFIEFSKITGFRKPNYNEITHEFPLIKKGSKLPVNL